MAITLTGDKRPGDDPNIIDDTPVVKKPREGSLQHDWCQNAIFKLDTQKGIFSLGHLDYDVKKMSEDAITANKVSVDLASEINWCAFVLRKNFGPTRISDTKMFAPSAQFDFEGDFKSWDDQQK